jgi:hypothetical protein
VLKGIIAYGGDMVPAIMRFEQDATRNAAIVEDQKTAEQQLSSAVARLKDAFSTLTGRARLKTYPSKWDDQPK